MTANNRDPGSHTPSTYTGVRGYGVVDHIKITDGAGNVVDLDPVVELLVEIRDELRKIRESMEG